MSPRCVPHATGITLSLKKSECESLDSSAPGVLTTRNLNLTMNATTIYTHIHLNGHALCWYDFSRPCVESLDPSHFLGCWGLDRLPKGPDLLSYLDTFMFSVGGYDDDPRELFEIPEVRAFLCAFNRAWPYWFFACNLDVPNLRMMTWCCLPSLQVSRRDGEYGVRIRWKPSEFQAFITHGLAGMDILFDRAGAAPVERHSRTSRVLHYLTNDFNG